MMTVTVRLEDRELVRCSYLWLDPHAPNAGRRFVFRNIQYIDNVIEPYQTISIQISVINKLGSDHILDEFNFFILDYDKDLQSKDEWWIYGLIYQKYEMEYKQGVIDTFNRWQNERPFEWKTYQNDPDLKLNYISACRIYSGLPKKLSKKERYNLDLSLVKDEADFCLMASLEFIGDRGYLGYDLYTFDDCLLEIFHHKGFFEGQKVLLSNTTGPFEKEMAELIGEAKRILSEYEFSIEEDPQS